VQLKVYERGGPDAHDASRPVLSGGEAVMRRPPSGGTEDGASRVQRLVPALDTHPGAWGSVS